MKNFFNQPANTINALSKMPKYHITVLMMTIVICWYLTAG